VQIDLAKLRLVPGGSILVQLSESFGDSLSKNHLHNVFDTQETTTGETFRVVDVAYQQSLFQDRVELRFGRLDAADDFLVSPYNYLFVQSGFDAVPAGIVFNSPGTTTPPEATWGAMVSVKPTARTYVMAGVYNGDPSIRENDRHGVDLSLKGPLFAIGEVGYQANGLPGDTHLPGNYKAGFWYDDGRFTDFDTGGAVRGSWGWYGLFDQVLLPFGRLGSNRGFGVFGSAVFGQDPSVARMPFFCNGGAAARGIFESRPIDTCGLGVVYGHFSHELLEAERAAQPLDPHLGLQEYEMVIEATYRFFFQQQSYFIQPDLQYIVNPGATRQYHNAIVVGCQIGVNF
jgi:porin